MKHQLCVSVCLLGLASAALTATHSDAQPPRYTFRCSFSEGQIKKLEKDRYSAPTPDKFSDELIFDTGDMRRGRITGGDIVEDADVIPALHTTTFFQRTFTGGVVVTTVMYGPKTPPSLPPQRVPAAMSRHMLTHVGINTVSQYFGSCRVLM